ncbi:CRISPR-associated endonuclease Cas1 [Fusobacterium polymorphum]|uniref:CRISPR-associated endonuclease Cas1 n=1 Tax=Fusobacterium nucleatum subsp. polymorphum TaxID=76857 RepID=UPI00300A569E
MEKIFKKRINLGLNTSDLAKLLNYSNRSYIEKIEADKMYPSTKKIPDIAKALSCDIEDLFKNVEFQEEDDDYIFIKKILKSIKSFEENKYPKRNLALSKIFVKTKIKNQRNLLFRENVSAKEPAAIYSTRILTLLNDVDKAQSIEELNLIVEKMNTFNFTGLSYFLGDDFNFTTRVKMSPKDLFNSMLSFGYTLLIYEIQNKDLNPYIEFFASDEEGIPCLCSNLMEEWRTILVDSLAFKLLKTKKLTLNDFITNEKNRCSFPKKEARNIFINEFGELLKKEYNRHL